MDARREMLEQLLSDYVEERTEQQTAFAWLDAEAIARLRSQMSEDELNDCGNSLCPDSLMDIAQRTGGMVNALIRPVFVGDVECWRIEMDTLMVPTSLRDPEWLATLMGLGPNDVQVDTDAEGSQFYILWWD